MIKICHVTSVHPNNDGRIFRLECTSLAAHGYDVYHVAQGTSREENGVHVIGLGDMPESRLKRMTSFTKKIVEKALELDCDIYHLHDPELLQYALKIKKAGKKVIFDSHENTLEQIEEKEWIPGIVRKPASWAYKKYAFHVMKNIDGLISVTPHIVDQLKMVNPNTWMITNYPRFVEYKTVPKDKDHISLCFTGGIEAQWNHDRIIKAIDNLPDVSYNLCGSGSAPYIEELKALPGWKKVNYLGRVPFAESIGIQLKSNIGVALLRPSRNTAGQLGTLGNTKLFEYMMAGLPVICTNFELWEEIINKYNCGICIKPDDEEGLKKAILYLKENPKIALQMGTNGKLAVKNYYNWSSQEEELIRIYKTVGG